MTDTTNPADLSDDAIERLIAGAAEQAATRNPDMDQAVAEAVSARARQRGPGGKFLSATAERTIVDPHQRSTVRELPDGSKTIVSPTTREELPDGSTVIRAPVDPLAREASGLDEPRIFTNPTQPNVTLAGSLYKTGPGEWREYPTGGKHYLRFINGHCAARTDQQAEKILRHFKTVGRRQRVWEEPAPLLSEDQARARGIEPPYLFYDAQGKVAFWTYHREALAEFNRTYMNHQG
jgi:hypothetical protein